MKLNRFGITIQCVEEELDELLSLATIEKLPTHRHNIAHTKAKLDHEKEVKARHYAKRGIVNISEVAA